MVTVWSGVWLLVQGRGAAAGGEQGSGGGTGVKHWLEELLSGNGVRATNSPPPVAVATPPAPPPPAAPLAPEAAELGGEDLRITWETVLEEAAKCKEPSGQLVLLARVQVRRGGGWLQCRHT